MDFEWSVSEAGYEADTMQFNQYRSARLHGFHRGAYSLPTELVGKGRVVGPVVYARDSFGGEHRVKLRDHPLLFENFAELTPSEDNILKFARRYGLLGVTTGVLFPIRENKDQIKRGEPLQLWALEVVSLRVALKLWQMYENDDEAGLKQYVCWSGGNVTLHNPPGFDDLREFGNRTLETIGTIYWDEVPTLEEGDVLTPARHWVQEVVNERLEAFVALRIAEDEAGNLVYSYQPKHLLGALWYQFSQVITGIDRLNRCLMCNKPIIVKRGGRSDKVYCSDKCKMRASRAGKRVRKRAPVD